MVMSRLSGATWVLSAGFAGMLLVGCSASVSVEKSTGDEESTVKMSSGKLADLVAEELADSTGQAKPDISCPEDVEGEVGNATRCTLTGDDGSTLGVSVTVSDVDGSQMYFDIQADETASPAPN